MKATRKKASKKEFILKKAAQMFREKGFAATSMRDLAETVGIEAASLYNHIRSKNEMLESICFDVANRFTIFMDELESGNQGTIKKIDTLLRFHIKQMIETFEEVIVNGNILTSLTFLIFITSAAATANVLLLSLKKAFQKMRSKGSMHPQLYL